MTKTSDKRIYRIKRHARVRAKIKGSAERPRIAVFKSNQHIFVQAIDDVAKKTLAGAGDFDMKKVPAPKEGPKGRKERMAHAVGTHLADQLKKLEVKEAVFDTGGFKYHGRVKAVAEGLREGGIKI